MRKSQKVVLVAVTKKDDFTRRECIAAATIRTDGRHGATRVASRQKPWSARRARLLRLPRAFAHELLIGLVGRFGRAATLLQHAALNNPLLP